MRIWQGFQKGVDLGGWYSQCDHTEAHYDGFITERDLERIRSWGADHVRVPIDYELVENGDASVRESGYLRLEKTVAWCRKYGLNMMLDLHKTAGYSFDAGEAENGFFENAAYQERFYRLWETIAARFGKDSDMLAFELLNEVTDRAWCEAWNRIAAACIRRIRAFAPDTYIVVGGYDYNSVRAVKDLALPADEKIVYNFHCYEPMIFSHQGAYWIPTMDRSFRIRVDADFGTMAEATRKQFDTERTVFDGKPAKQTLDAGFFRELFREAVQTAEARNVPLYCGEYGVIDRAAPEDALAWYRMIHAVFTEYGIGRAAWSYREMDFGLSDARMDGVREELLRCL